MHIVDTHAHLYSTDEGRYPMIPKPYRPPEGTGTIKHLRRVTQDAGVTRVVAVQTGSAYRWDNRLVADLVRANRDWMTGTCNLNPVDPESSDKLADLVENFGIRAIRLEPAEGAYEHEGSIALFRRTQELGTVIQAHIHAAHADELARLMDRSPEVPVVLDHCMYVKSAEAPEFPTVRKVLEFARYPNLHPKLSFLVSGSDEPYPCRDTHDLSRQILDAFGPDRCMWGSDFPTELWIPKVTYRQHLNIFQKELGLTPDEVQAILETASMRVWFG